MTKNLYMLQTKDGQDYAPSNRQHVNRLIELGEAEWVGTDGDEETDIVTHYADRIEP